VHASRGRCVRCYHHDVERVHDTVERIIAGLGRTPAWLPGFAEHLAGRLSVERTIILLNELEPLLSS
jgi:hypothetical protein